MPYWSLQLKTEVLVLSISVVLEAQVHSRYGSRSLALATVEVQVLVLRVAYLRAEMFEV